jgi:Ran GTPase-activating protein (RanGAP) involved in mRNA processing and transport
MAICLQDTKISIMELSSMINNQAGLTDIALTNVEIHGNEDDMFTLAKSFRGHPTLQSVSFVNVRSASLDQSIAMMLVSCPKLKAVKLQNSPVSASAISGCGYCSTLHTLELPDCNFDDTAAACIAAALIASTSIVVLDLSKNNFSDKGCTAIASALEKNSSVQTVKLDGNGQITSGQMERVMQLTRAGGRAQAA